MAEDAIKNNYKKINLIQHIGVGVPDTDASWKWYRKFFGMDVPMFDSVKEAPLMLIYTNNKVVNKRATMVLNLQGGSAMEIVQLKNFGCKNSDFTVQLGDLGIFIVKIKVKNVHEAFEYFKKNSAHVLSEVQKSPDGKETFFVKDINDLVFQIIPNEKWFSANHHVSGGIAGCVIGVSDIDKAKKFYCDLLGFNKIVYDKTGIFDDLKNIPGGNSKYRRVLLEQNAGSLGAFSEMVGAAYIELVQAMDRVPQKIFKDRIWGDKGFVHLAFDVRGMKQIEKEFSEKGFPFTCDSKNALNMGDHTEVHCIYVEDPDGTLIEFTEVYKIPILKKIGWFLDVEKRDPKKPLPSWILKGMRFSRVKD